MFQIVAHGVGDPGNITAQCSAGFLDVHQTFFQSKGLDVAIQFRMLQVFIDVVELNAFGSVVAVDGLQTGDVVQKRRSCETPEH